VRTARKRALPSATRTAWRPPGREQIEHALLGMAGEYQKNHSQLGASPPGELWQRAKSFLRQIHFALARGGKFAYVQRMNWFTTLDEFRTVPRQGPDDELARVELEYQAAERELDNAKEAVRQYGLWHPRPDAVQIVHDGGYLRVM
jgi:hypothetical protein